MAYKTSYTGAKMDELFGKSRSFEVNDQSWNVISSDITTLDISKVQHPGNYVYSGKLYIPEMDQLYGYNTTAKQAATTLTGSYMIFVRMVNYNVYQMISSHGIEESTDDLIVIAWIRQPNYTYIPKIYRGNEPSNSMFGFATSEASDKGIHKYPNQLRKFDNTGLKYYEAATDKYVSFISSGSMSTAIYGSIDSVFTKIDSSLAMASNWTDHMNDDTIHVTAIEKTDYASKLKSDDATSTLDAWQTTFLKEVNDQIAEIKTKITADISTVSTISSSLTTHESNSVKHPSSTQIANWNSKADKDHTHTEDEITISADDVIGVLDPSNISDEAKEKQVTVSTKTKLLALTKSDVHNGCWVLQKSATSDVITYYVVVDDTKLGTEAAFQQLSTTPYKSTDLVWSNITGAPTTVDELGLAVSNSTIDSMVSEANTLATAANTSVNAVIDKVEPLKMQDDSFAMENLIDMIDYKMQLIQSLISNNP